MKKMYSTAAALLCIIAVSAQCSVTILNHTNVTCNGDCNGSVTVATVGIGPYSYAWAPGGQTIQNPNDLCPGTHTVTMTDANSCQSTATVTITEPPILASSISQTGATCNGTCNGSATVTATGGTPNYSYMWDTTAASQTTATANNLCAGNYWVWITDANGCMDSNSVTVTQPTALMVSTSSSSPTCQLCTDGSATATASGGTPSYTYSWSPGGQTTATATNLGSGTYVVTVTDALGCTQVDTVVVSTPNGIIDQYGDYTISIYPNPVKDNINLAIVSPSDRNMRVVISDVTGKIISTSEFTSGKVSTHVLNMADVPAGCYFIEIISDDLHVTKKVVRE